MKKIKLTRGKYALVDNEDYEYLKQFNWNCNAMGYAERYAGTGRKNKKVSLMHREINVTPKGFSTDHINRNKLDNRRKNLRTVTQSENGQNRGLNKNNKSGHKGIYLYRDGKLWIAGIKVKYKKIHLGYFSSIEDAIKARKNAELKYFSL